MCVYVYLYFVHLYKCACILLMCICLCIYVYTIVEHTYWAPSAHYRMLSEQNYAHIYINIIYIYRALERERALDAALTEQRTAQAAGLDQLQVVYVHYVYTI